MRQLKHLVGALLCLVLFAGSFSIRVQASESGEATDIQSGTCGENVVWQLVGDTLTISGSGEMDDYVVGGGSWTPYNLNIKKVVIQEGVTSIGDGAFRNCSYLTEIEMAESIKSIGRHAFGLCNSLTNIVIPSNITRLEEDAFFGCENIETIVVDETNEYYCAENNVLFDKSKRTLLRYASKKQGSYIIPDGVTRIGNSAFDACLYLTEVTIPREVTTIGEHAFLYAKDYVVIRGYANSAAEEYANSNNITFIELEDEGDIVTIGGAITSYGDGSDQVLISVQGTEGAIEATTNESSGSYQLKDVSAGTYTISVSKEHHVPRTYTVTVNDANVTQNMEIYLMGDVTGDGSINARDKKLVYNHIAGTSLLTDYIFAVGDVTGDGVINARDKKLIYNHIAGTSSLWK